MYMRRRHHYGARRRPPTPTRPYQSPHSLPTPYAPRTYGARYAHRSSPSRCRAAGGGHVLHVFGAAEERPPHLCSLPYAFLWTHCARTNLMPLRSPSMPSSALSRPCVWHGVSRARARGQVPLLRVARARDRKHGTASARRQQPRRCRCAVCLVLCERSVCGARLIVRECARSYRRLPACWGTHGVRPNG